MPYSGAATVTVDVVRGTANQPQVDALAPVPTKS